MANAEHDTDGSQLVIGIDEAGVGLVSNFSLFGQVTGGIDAVEEIAATEQAEGQSSMATAVLSGVIVN